MESNRPADRSYKESTHRMYILEHKQKFIEILNGLDSSKSRWDNFNNFCEMSYCTLAKVTANKDTAEKLEARYMRIIGTYENKG